MGWKGGEHLVNSKWRGKQQNMAVFGPWPFKASVSVEPQDELSEDRSSEIKIRDELSIS